LGGVAGFCLGGVGWLVAGAWWTRRLGEKYPPGGPVDIPSPQVIDAAFATLCCASFAALAGAALGAVLLTRLVRPRQAPNETEPSRFTTPGASASPSPPPGSRCSTSPARWAAPTARPPAGRRTPAST